MSGRRALLGRVLRVAFGLVGAAFLVVSFVRTWDGSVAEVTLSWWRPALAGLLAMGALTCAFQGWARLVSGHDRRALAQGFYLSQLGKYIPGGIWQALGQVGYTARANVSMPHAATAFAVFTLTQAAAGGLVGASVGVLLPELGTGLRLGAAAGLGLALLLHRRWMVFAVSIVRRMRDKNDAEDLVPGQRSILLAAAWSVATMVANGAAFALLLDGLSPLGVGTAPAAAVAAAGLAWTVGFLALPVPAGIGVREGALILLLGPVAGTPALIVASIYQRLITIAAEALMIVLTRWLPEARGERPGADRSPEASEPREY